MVLFRGSLGYDVGKTVTTQRGAVTPQVSSKPKAAGKAKQSRVKGSFFVAYKFTVLVFAAEAWC